MSQNFTLLAESDLPTVIGKAWWNEALKLSKTGDQRRTLIAVAAAVGGLMIVPPVCGIVIAAAADDDDVHRRERRDALKAQREFGWTFGAADQVPSIAIPGPPLSAEMDALVETLAPKNPRWRPAYVPTLFQALAATPTSPTLTEDAVSTGVPRLRDVIHPMFPTTAISLNTQAVRLANCLASQAAGVALVVDLAGPDSVVFAQALSTLFDPVFLFDNWPHPRGVVPAHLTLAAALASAPELARHKAARPTEAPPAFVLDRNRLAPYTDEATEFDNRSLARLPTVEMLKAAGVSRVYYLTPPGAVPIEKDDVVDDLVAFAARGISVRALDFGAYASLDNATACATFERDYGAAASASGTTTATTTTTAWRPAPRASAFSTGVAVSQPTHARPSGFGEVPVVVHMATGALLGAALYRNGSWNRMPTSSTYYGGG